MEEKRDYTQDLSDIRSMMERSSKFLSLSGWAGIMAGLYAITGAWAAYSFFDFFPDELFYTSDSQNEVILIALGVLLLALVTAILFSRSQARKKEEKIWNATSRRLLGNMAIPLIVGGFVISMLVSIDLIGLVAPMMLIFYGLSLVIAGNFTISEVRWMGFVQLGLGLLAAWFVEYGLILWVLGFGVVHIVYGIYMHFNFKR
ncbi:MAG: hypothetical protein ED557_09845 [Balneola sp.]|nr:MAG: hypothetical protein ED557_09845 [Balneola sp.]